MRLTLNIGLAREGNSNIGVGTALRELNNMGFAILRHAGHTSDTELTLVVDADDKDQPGRDNRIAMLSARLGQDCIAVYDYAAQEGDLIGPNAAAWGEFNPAYFLNLDGTRLGN